MDQRTRKLMTMYKTLQRSDDVDRVCVPRKEGGRGLASIEDSVDASIQYLEHYTQKRERRLITATRYNADNTRTNRTTITRKKNGKKKQIYGRFKRLISNNSHVKTWKWVWKVNLKRETYYLLIAGHNNAKRTNHIKARIDKTQQNSKCRLRGDRDETINNIISECSKLAQKGYKTRHDCVSKVILWELCKKFRFNQTKQWYMHNPTKNDTHKLCG